VATPKPAAAAKAGLKSANPRRRTQPAKASAAALPPSAAPTPQSEPAVVVAATPPTLAMPRHFPVVALGASAGGLEAFQQFLHAMPAHSGVGFVLIQHLDPSHDSLLVNILQRHTTMPVVEAANGMAVAADRVHVAPPNRDMTIAHGVLQLSPASGPRGQRMPIDTFLRSLADDQDEHAVGIVLSGTGSDGALGLRALSGAGGLCLVQEPASALFDGMPRSAAPYAHRVLAIAQMPQALARFVQGVSGAGAPSDDDAPAPSTVAAVLPQLLALLQHGLGHDFSQYKKSTLCRRIERRMAHHGLNDARAYQLLLQEQPAELTALFRELLINVTSFFRDAPAFAMLKTKILPALLSAKAEGQPLRVWVAGCATGEELYSIAIVLRELLDEHPQRIKVQMYGTDLDDDAVASARAGLYPPGIAQDLSPERLQRFFIKEATGYRVVKDVREMAVFAVQSVIKDPPFTRVDLLSCRNLMIYLEPVLQDRLIPLFHYALRPGGVLLLSPSESVGDHVELFDIIDRRWKFYRARPVPAATRAKAAAGGAGWEADAAGVLAPNANARSVHVRMAELARRGLLQAFAPAAVLTDIEGNLLYVHGDTGRFLRLAPGQPSQHLADMARDGLGQVLREALHRAADQGLPTLDRVLQVAGDAGLTELSLGVRPLHDSETGAVALLVSFQELHHAGAATPRRKPRAGTAAEQSRIELLQRELAQAQQSMRFMLEEQQAANEDLKSANEELQSTNEELQSTNEELETSREELQSVNEEQVTVNAELQSKIAEMALMQDDLKNLLDNIKLGTIFLDRALRVRRYTKDATRLYRLVPTDIGRPLADIRCDLRDGDLVPEAQAVLDTLQTTEIEVCTQAGSWYQASILPYRTVDNAIDGVVLTFADLTDRLQALAMRHARDLALAVVDTVQHPLVVLDERLQVISANRAYYQCFGGAEAQTVGQPWFSLNAGRWDLPAMREALQQVLPRAHGFEQRRLTLPAAAGQSSQKLRLSGRHVLGQSNDGKLVLLSIEPDNGHG